jgi:hypothetical protein
MFVFNASEVFGVSCDAALFVVKLGKNPSSICSVFDFDTGGQLRHFGWKDGVFFSDIPSESANTNIAGQCQFEWRQGIKHDCSKVMELNHLGGGFFQNGFAETVQLPVGDFVFPLLKSSDIREYEVCNTRKYVIVPQKRVNDDTSIIAGKSEVLWQYLKSHESLLNARRSVIYSKSPKFSVFGIGDYSFSKYKVGISGFYKEPVFSLIHSDNPVMLDDTCYFLGFDNLSDAVITTALLNSPASLSFLKSVAFLDSKRPYTKEILKRIDLLKLAYLVTYMCVCELSKKIGSGYSVSVKQFDEYKSKLSNKTGSPSSKPTKSVG